jgi:hypothetical protein
MSYISENLKRQFNEIAKILNSVGERVEGNFICDGSSENLVNELNKDKILNIQNLSKKSDNICEIGVNAGHSLLIMLEQSPNSNYTIFDLGNHGYTRPCMDYIKSIYPNTNINIIYGDSKKTIKKYISENIQDIPKFDLIHIDGGHENLELISDFYYTSLLGSPDCYYVFDDYHYPNIKSFLIPRIKSRIIVPSLDVIETPLHIVYKFPNN